MLKFILLSAFGTFAFFINFPLPAYTVFSYTVTAQSTILVTHFVNAVKALLWNGSFKAMPYIVLAIGVYGLADLYIRRKKHFATKVSALFSVFKIIGFVLLLFIVFQFGPEIISQPVESLGGKSIGAFILNNILVSICISIPAASLFLPFLLDYGLVDFVGVLSRPIMRPLFKLPGRAAVIMVSAFLGNFSIGHIAVNDQYKTGRMTAREGYVIGSSLSTVSVGFLMVLATNTHIMEHWNVYFWTAFLITLLVTVVGVRIRPLSKAPDTYYPGVSPRPEPVYSRGLVKNAWREAVDIAENADHPLRRIAYIQRETLGVLGTVATGTAFFATVGVILYTYTPIFSWIGYIFYPFMRIALGAQEALTASTGASISFLEVTIPALLVTTGVWTLRIRYILAIIPVTSIVFLASFVPCLMGTELPVKFGELAVIWLERMLLSVLIAALFSLFLFPAGAV
jgi:nucleoside recognition membrane protein YjiH